MKKRLKYIYYLLILIFNILEYSLYKVVTLAQFVFNSLHVCGFATIDIVWQAFFSKYIQKETNCKSNTYVLFPPRNFIFKTNWKPARYLSQYGFEIASFPKIPQAGLNSYEK